VPEEVANVVQTLVVVLLILAGGVLVQSNIGALETPISVALPGAAGATVTVLDIILAAAAALVVAWLAGQVDRAFLAWRLLRRERTVRIIRDEVAPSGPVADERQPSVMYVSLSNIHNRLDAIEQQLDALRQRLDAALGTRASVRSLRQ